MISFIFVISFLQIHQTRMFDEIREERKIILYDTLTSTIDALIINKGYPENWDSNNVYSLGLVESPHVLSRSKLENFSRMEKSELKRLMGIRGTDFYFSIGYENDTIVGSRGVLTGPVAYLARQTSDTSFLSVLNSSGLVWDFYWSGGAAPANNARNVYLNANDITLMKWAIENRTNYSTIVYEDIHVSDTDISSGERDALKGWVNSSGTYIHIQHNEDFLRTFGIANISGSDEDTGYVNEKDVIINATSGQYIDLQSSAKMMGTYNPPYPLKTIVNSSGTPGYCIVCRWSYVNGAIYYLPDGSLQTGSLAISTEGLVGINFSTGTFPPANATDVFSSSRNVILEGKRVKMVLLLWH